MIFFVKYMDKIWAGIVGGSSVERFLIFQKYAEESLLKEFQTVDLLNDYVTQ